MSKVMLFEESPDEARVLATSLEQRGYEVIQCSDEEKGVELMDNGEVNLAVVEFFSHYEEGRRFLSHLEETNHAKLGNVIITMNKTDKEELGRIFQLPTSGVFIKPYSLQALLDRVDKVASQQWQKEQVMDTQVILIFLESTVSVFSNAGEFSLRAGKPYQKVGNQAIQDVSAVIEFSSPKLKGTMAISLGYPMLEIILRKLLPQITEEDIDETSLKDCCGELANQILGRAKGRFLRDLGLNFEMNIPSVLAGENHILDYRRDETTLVIPFSWSSYTVFLEFALQLPSEEEGSQEVKSEGETNTLEEGELMLF